MDISVFEVIGPVMIGPSSSGTAGMARLGCAAHKFLSEPLKSIDIKFHPRNTGCFGLRSHFALLGGAMGIPEYDPRLRDALKIAREQGIELSTSKFTDDPLPHSALTVKLSMVQKSGKHCDITGISVGGGSIAITDIDEFAVELVSTAAYLFVWADRDITAELNQIFGEKSVRSDEKGGKYLFYVNLGQKKDPAAEGKVQGIAGITRTLAIDPFLSFGYVPHEPLITSFEQLQRMSDETGKDAFELAMEYEMNRSGRSREEIWQDMAQVLEYMKGAVEEGLSKDIKTLFQFGSGVDGKKLMKAMQEGKTLSGSTMNRAVAKALATMEVDCAMGRVVAAPTAGSCGIVPGCFLTVQEDRNLSDETVIKGLFVAAVAGVAMYYHKASFSGLGGGCQGEIGVSSAIAAAGLAYLGGGDTHQVIHACALALKNILGLICDRIGGSSEIPCIRRNGMGVSNAFCGADLALAGIDSYIPPDEVVEALVDCQKRLPPELRGGCGGLTSTCMAALARQIEDQINKELTF